VVARRARKGRLYRRDGGLLVLIQAPMLSGRDAAHVRVGSAHDVGP
jgi:hypothetical protein